MSHKITKAQRSEMRKLYQMGWSKAEIAKLYDVSQPTVDYHVGFLTRYPANVVLTAQLQEAA